jgi:O-antigen/teichoic acid export membrane protein
MTVRTLQETTYRLLRTNAFVSLLGNGLSAILGLVTLAVLARVCTKEEFGKWILFLTVYSLADTLRSGLILNALIRHLAAETSPTMIRRWAGAAWQLSGAFLGVMTVLIFSIVIGARLLGYGEQWPALAGWIVGLSVAALPVNLSGWLLQARSRFRAMQSIRVGVQVLFLAFIGLGHYTHLANSTYLFATYTLTHLLIGLAVLAAGWAQGNTLLAGTVQERRSLLNFGRYTMGTLLVSNLLRTSDRLLLGALLGPESVVIYTLPQRLVELVEMPIRSIVITDMPRLAQYYANRSSTAWATFFNQQAGRLWIALLPLCLIGFLAAQPLVHLMGGDGYGDSADVLRFFMIYALVLPLDRYAGVGLDVVNKPQQNLLKVICMLAVNLIGDVVAILVFKSVVGVAFVSVGTFLVGLLLGFRLLRAHVPVSLLGSVQAGFATVYQFLKHVRHEWAR